MSLSLKNEEAVVITKIEGKGINRHYYVRQSDDGEQVLTYQELFQNYLGYAWFIKPKIVSDVRSELPEYDMPKACFCHLFGWWYFSRSAFSDYSIGYFSEFGCST